MSLSARARSIHLFASSRSARTAAHSAESVNGASRSGQPAWNTDLDFGSYGRFCQMSSAKWGSSGASATASASIDAEMTYWQERRRASSGAEMYSLSLPTSSRGRARTGTRCRQPSPQSRAARGARACDDRSEAARQTELYVIGARNRADCPAESAPYCEACGTTRKFA
eukprot:6214406-Pleurochrysis_carterae.AAC.8